MQVAVAPRFYRPKEACDVLRIGMATLHRRIKAGDIRTCKLGGARLISLDEIKRVTAHDQYKFSARRSGVLQGELGPQLKAMVPQQ